MTISTEKLHFKIGLSANYWAKIPKYSVIVNDVTIFTNKEIASPPNTIQYIEFDTELEEGPASLHIRLENKNWTDTIPNDAGTEMLRDMVLNIDSIEIEGIELGNLIYTQSKFSPYTDVPAMTTKQELVAYFNRGIAYKELTEFDKSLESFHQAIKLGANFAEVYNYCGDILKQQGKIDEANESYKQAIDFKNNPTIINEADDNQEAIADNVNASVTELDNCKNLGWNGTWKLAFASPFYIWLLENI